MVGGGEEEEDVEVEGVVVPVGGAGETGLAPGEDGGVAGAVSRPVVTTGPE